MYKYRLDGNCHGVPFWFYFENTNEGKAVVTLHVEEHIMRECTRELSQNEVLKLLAVFENIPALPPMVSRPPEKEAERLADAQLREQAYAYSAQYFTNTFLPMVYRFFDNAQL